MQLNELGYLQTVVRLSVSRVFCENEVGYSMRRIKYETKIRIKSDKEESFVKGVKGCDSGTRRQREHIATERETMDNGEESVKERDLGSDDNLVYL
jgi:hypothetical protein